MKLYTGCIFSRMRECLSSETPGCLRGFVDVRPDGQRRLYWLRPEPFPELDAWISGYRNLWKARLDRFGDALRRSQTARARRRKETKK
jgi:hypothetical protein